ncbi:MAG: nucleotidyltransferase family protein [Thermoflexales bacterium]|nr:nucleotidyltransferase family protein [Thermoflexales bacterium]
MTEFVAGIILAAGASRRMERPKPLLTWRGEPFIRRIARTALAAGLWPVVIVTGAHAEEVRAAVADLPVEVSYNPDWEAGQSTSVRAGLSSLPPETGAAIFLLADQPHIPAALVEALVAKHAQTGAPLVAPLVGERRGNPVLFDRAAFPELMSLRGDVGGRQLFSRHRADYVPWHDSSPLLDIDTPEDYELLAGLLEQKP